MTAQARVVRHRWNLPEGQEPPQPGDTICGKTHAHSWVVVEVIPIDSPVHPNAFLGRLRQMGPWSGTGIGFDWVYGDA